MTYNNISLESFEVYFYVFLELVVISDIFENVTRLTLK